MEDEGLMDAMIMTWAAIGNIIGILLVYGGVL